MFFFNADMLRSRSPADLNISIQTKQLANFETLASANRKLLLTTNTDSHSDIQNDFVSSFTVYVECINVSFFNVMDCIDVVRTCTQS